MQSFIKTIETLVVFELHVLRYKDCQQLLFSIVNSSSA